MGTTWVRSSYALRKVEHQVLDGADVEPAEHLRRLRAAPAKLRYRGHVFTPAMVWTIFTAPSGSKDMYLAATTSWCAYAYWPSRTARATAS